MLYSWTTAEDRLRNDPPPPMWPEITLSAKKVDTPYYSKATMVNVVEKIVGFRQFLKEMLCNLFYISFNWW